MLYYIRLSKLLDFLFLVFIIVQYFVNVNLLIIAPSSSESRNLDNQPIYNSQYYYLHTYLEFRIMQYITYSTVFHPLNFIPSTSLGHGHNITLDFTSTCKYMPKIRVIA